MSVTLPERRSARGASRYLWRSLLFLAALATLGALFQRPLTAAFLTNPYLNGTIAVAFLFGVSYTLKALVDTWRDVRVGDRVAEVALKARRREIPLKQADELLLNGRWRGVSEFIHKVYRVVSHGDASTTLPYLLDSLATRGDDQRALVRYLVGALVLLGLIGTFYGLLLTITGVREVIGGLATEKGVDTMTLIANFKDRLAAPLGGMGTSFSASLFGLLSALALGFLELQLFHAQNNYHAQLETLAVSELVPLWQPVVTVTASTETISPRHLAALLQSTTDRLERIAATIEYLANRGEGVTRVAEQVASLGERIESLRTTLQDVENDRTADLRHELRTIAHLLAQRPGWPQDPDHAPSA
ncbi:MAG TPA: hypothetical protein PKI41_00520 [Candidatus Competibacteraceae bacterium]|nr:MAG: hypothetical protein EKK71_02295 [Candidatus Competibacteraceae bacterium]HOB60588.1 hypothetical protein [Candidatus Competibacteraceae bacterium]HQA24710.1 hypothetical protein [Candidatus Competibacteraceae bacterium]HQD54959.1 hypothetical protein [Candidatus Competibacteraceae bacterium]